MHTCMYTFVVCKLQVEVHWNATSSTLSAHCDTVDLPAPPPLPINVNIKGSVTTADTMPPELLISKNASRDVTISVE